MHILIFWSHVDISILSKSWPKCENLNIRILNIFNVSLFQNEKGESEMTSIEFETKQVSHEIGEKLVLPAQPDKGIQVR